MLQMTAWDSGKAFAAWDGVASYQLATGSRPERATGHIGTEIRPRLLREAAVGNIAQWAKA